MVICHCNQLRVLDLSGLEYVTGMCVFCEDPGPKSCFRTLQSMINLQQVNQCLQRPPLNHIVSRYILAFTFIIFSLILNFIACSSQRNRIIIIIIFKDLGGDKLCFPHSVQYRVTIKEIDIINVIQYTNRQRSGYTICVVVQRKDENFLQAFFRDVTPRQRPLYH